MATAAVPAARIAGLYYRAVVSWRHGLTYLRSLVARQQAAPAPAPGGLRPVVVPSSLDDLHGPASGVVELPVRLYWSGSRQFNLADSHQVAALCEAVLDTAGTLDDIERYLNADLLIRVWPVLGMSRVKRDAWESRFPVLRRQRAVTAAQLLLDGRHHDIVRIALTAAGRKYQVAFAGGGALQIHDVSARRTQDVDLFVRKARNVARAADVIADALEEAGYRVETVNADSRGQVDLSQELREFEVYPPDAGDPVQVQVAFFAYTGTVIKDVGPVVTLDYLGTRKTVALLERHQVRDYIDVASLVDAGYKIPRLLDMAFAEEPSLSAEDVGDAGVHLDQIADERLARELPPGKTPGWVRAVFADWPRSPVHAEVPLA